MAADGEFAEDRRGLHISVAATAWILILIRIAWRVREGHPHVRGQTVTIHTIARYTHYASLAAVAAMLLSGPVIVWTRGHPINVFDLLSIPSPFSPSEAIAEVVLRIHASAAIILMVLIVVHVGGALKHLMFHNDDTIVRMIWPGRQQQDETER
jgi:cytochrome b561